jgi:hypothetical protein
MSKQESPSPNVCENEDIIQESEDEIKTINTTVVRRPNRGNTSPTTVEAVEYATKLRWEELDSTTRVDLCRKYGRKVEIVTHI